MMTVNLPLSTHIEASALLQETRHLLVLPPGLSFEAKIPETITDVRSTADMFQGLLDECEYRGDRVKIEWLRLPAFDVPDNLGCLLAFAEVDQVSGQGIFAAILDELERCEEDA